MAAVPDVILPALDEEAALPWVLGRMPDGYRPIVVDNGSTDHTAEVARELGATVVVEARQGFGAACWAGLGAATADVVCFMDADASFDPTELPLVAEPVLAGTADLALGARHAGRGAWPWHARLANRVLAAEVRRRSGAAVTDLGPMRVDDVLRWWIWACRTAGRAGRSRWCSVPSAPAGASRRSRSATDPGWAVPR